MKTISLFRRGRRLFCPFLIGCALISTRSAFAHSPLGTISSHIIIQQQVTGTVSDASGPLSGVTVSVKGKPAAALTDSEGKFRIDALPNDVLVFSYVGYQTLELSVQGKAVLDVKLQEDVATLQEVTVNAGYYKVKDKERTGSIAKITSKDIETQPVTNVLATMQGRMAGVNITQNTGTPGGGFDIAIRGVNSLRPDGNRPLFIIDGMPYSSDAIGARQNSLVLPAAASPLNSINPDQIESIEVLKDADATATDSRLPLPESELSLNPNLLPQNPGY